jgi:hypothetical protein
MAIHWISKVGAVIVGALASIACGEDQELGIVPEAIGEVCVAGDESEPAFSGFELGEVVIEDGNAQCEAGACVVHGFQGRVGCPYGQAEGESECSTSSGSERVSVSVEPQLVSRPPSSASVCSCLCAGSGDGPFCKCPETFECVRLIGPPGNEAKTTASYCLAKGTAYAPAAGRPALCDADLANCVDREN